MNGITIPRPPTPQPAALPSKPIASTVTKKKAEAATVAFVVAALASALI